MKEGKFQTWFIKQLRDIFPGCLVFKTSPNYLQGCPDLFMIWEDRWAAFEVKRSESEALRPNQDYYISKMNSMSYAEIVYPENAEEVLDAVQRALSS